MAEEKKVTMSEVPATVADDNSFTVGIADSLSIGTGDTEIIFNTMPTTTTAEKKALFNACNGDTKRIGDFVNKTIPVAHIVVERVEIKNEETGVFEAAPRTIIVSPDGTGYTAVSKGVFNSVKKIIKIFGLPEFWDEPLSVEVIQITKGKNNILTLNVK